MGVASLIFEPHPPNFANQYNFFRWTNDVTMVFWYLYWFQIYKNPQGVSFPGAPVFFGYYEINYSATTFRPVS